MSRFFFFFRGSLFPDPIQIKSLTLIIYFSFYFSTSLPGKKLSHDLFFGARGSLGGPEELGGLCLGRHRVAVPQFWQQHQQFQRFNQVLNHFTYFPTIFEGIHVDWSEINIFMTNLLNLVCFNSKREESGSGSEHVRIWQKSRSWNQTLMRRFPIIFDLNSNY